MDRRLSLQEILVNILESPNVYFQPPETIKLHYPCIIYERDDIDQKYANNRSYISMVRYSITLITRSPESDLVKKILELPYCSYDRYYASDTLNHDVFTLYY